MTNRRRRSLKTDITGLIIRTATNKEIEFVSSPI